MSCFDCCVWFCVLLCLGLRGVFLGLLDYCLRGTWCDWLLLVVKIGVVTARLLCGCYLSLLVVGVWLFRWFLLELFWFGRF